MNWNLSPFISVFDSNPEIWLFTSELLKSEAEKVEEFFYTNCTSSPQVVADTKHINSTQPQIGFFLQIPFLENLKNYSRFFKRHTQIHIIYKNNSNRSEDGRFKGMVFKKQDSIHCCTLTSHIKRPSSINSLFQLPYVIKTGGEMSRNKAQKSICLALILYCIIFSGRRWNNLSNDTETDTHSKASLKN